MWGLAIAVVAGILQDKVVLCIAHVACLRFVVSTRAKRREAALLVLLLIFLYGYGYFTISRYGDRVVHFQSFASAAANPIYFTGWVSSFPQQRYGRTTFQFVTAIDGVRHEVLVRSREFGIQYGDSLRILAHAGASTRSRFGESSYLRSHGLSGVIRALPGGVTRVGGSAGSAVARRLLWPVHEGVRREIIRGIGSGSGVSLALLVGDRAMIGHRTRDAFVQLGISHLLALSGLHLGFVAGTLLFLLRPLGSRRGALLILILVLYVGVVGLVVSLYRALLMAAILIVAADTHRPLRPMTSLGNAFLILLIVYPCALFSVAFQLSFLATFAVLVCVKRLEAPPQNAMWAKAWYWIRCTVRVSVAVQVVLAPMLLFYFDRISVIAPLATALFVGPVVGLLVLSACAVAVAMVFPLAGTWCFRGLEPVAAVFDELLMTAARFAPEPVEAAAPNPFPYYVGLALMWHSHGRWWMKSLGALAVAAAWFPSPGLPLDF